MAETHSPQMHLGAMLSEVADRVATGRMGDVSECVLFIRGRSSAAIVTLPAEPIEDTERRLDTAKHYLQTGELEP